MSSLQGDSSAAWPTVAQMAAMTQAANIVRNGLCISLICDALVGNHLPRH
jgi:hypothetical protein